MSVSERYKYFTGTLMHKHINNPSDNLLNNFLFNIFFTLIKMSIIIKREKITLLSLNIEQSNLN